MSHCRQPKINHRACLLRLPVHAKEGQHVRLADWHRPRLGWASAIARRPRGKRSLLRSAEAIPICLRPRKDQPT